MDLKIIDEKKKAGRLEEWKVWVRKFEERNPDVVPIPNAAELLNDYYWRLALYFLKPMLNDIGADKEHNLHYYKIISASELTVMSVMPFKLKKGNSEEEWKHANADFAWMVALSIFINWETGGRSFLDLGKLDQIIFAKEIIDVTGNDTKYYPLNFMEEHIEWLKDLNIAGALPVLSNSQTWRLLFLASKLDQ